MKGGDFAHFKIDGHPSLFAFSIKKSNAKFRLSTSILVHTPMSDQSTPSPAVYRSVPAGTDLVEWYFEQGWTDGLPVVPPTPEKVQARVVALGGDPGRLECRVPPRHGSLSREVLAINLVLAGCKPFL